MPSLLPGFEYDIFISYRQNDNKYDGWVTEFVANLNKEIEATIKEKVTVYFDANPHDGLLETHSVDRSLEEKLRCLILIPILSRTYCDPNSYAWNNEFLAFLNISKEDNIGLNVKLSNGNVASRVLPVRIHDLNPEDIRMVESSIGVIRAVDFIYKEPGVNRPLRSNEDTPNNNLNKTHYRNQINKVANSIDEIIRSLKMIQPKHEGEKSISDQPPTKDQKEDKKRESSKDNRAKSKRWLIIALSALLCIAGVFVVYKVVSSWKQAENVSSQDKSIAVLPFADDSPGKDNEYLCNGMMEEILNQLQKIADLKVKSRTSVEKYRNPGKDIKIIGKELGVSLIMEGSVRRIGDDLRIATQLIDTKTGDHLWSEIYDGKYTTDIFEFQGNIAKKVAASLNAIITPLEEKRINTKSNSDIAAYDLYLKGMEMCYKWNYSFDSLYLQLGLNLFDQALIIDPDNVEALGGIGYIYREEGKFDSALYYYGRQNVIDPINLRGAGGIGSVYLYTDRFDSAFKYIQLTIDHNPNTPWSFAPMGQLMIMNRNDIIEGLPYYQKAIDLGGSDDAEINRHLAWTFSFMKDYPRALNYSANAIRIRSDCGLLIENAYYLIAQGNYPDALHFLDSVSSVTPCMQKCEMTKFRIYTEIKDFKKAETILTRVLNSGYNPTANDNIYIACFYKETGRIEDAFFILNNSIKQDENSLKEIKFIFNKFVKLRLAASYAMVGKSKEAITLLKELQKSGIWEPYFVLKSFPGFDSLLSDPDFQTLVKRIENEKDSIRAQVKQMELRGEIDL